MPPMRIVDGHPKFTAEEREHNTKLWTQRLVGKKLTEDSSSEDAEVFTSYLPCGVLLKELACC